MFDRSGTASSPVQDRSHFWGLGAFQFLIVAGLAACLFLTKSPFDALPDLPPPVPWAEATRAVEVPIPRPREQVIVSDPLVTGSIPELPPPVRTRDFVSYGNRDMFGGDYETVKNATLGECESRCASDSRCRAYTFNKWQGACFLKSSIGVVRIEPQGITGVVALEKVKEQPLPPTIQRSRSQRFSDEPYKVLTSREYDRCASACLSDSRCMGFNFSRPDGSCSLMSSLEKPAPSRVTDIGMKVQRLASERRRSRVSDYPLGHIPPEIAPLFDAVLRELSR